MFYAVVCSLVALTLANAYGNDNGYVKEDGNNYPSETPSSYTGNESPNYPSGGSPSYPSGPSYPPSGNDHKKEYRCRKLRHFEIEGKLNERPEFRSLHRNGKNYVFVSCPNEGFGYSLYSEEHGEKEEVLLATGFNTGVLAECGRKDRYSARSADSSRKIKFRKVTCVKHPEQSISNDS